MMKSLNMDEQRRMSGNVFSAQCVAGVMFASRPALASLVSLARSICVDLFWGARHASWESDAEVG